MVPNTGQKAVSLLNDEFTTLLQEIINQVEGLSGEVADLGKDFVGFDFEVDIQGDENPIERTWENRSLRVYWYNNSKIPRVCFGFIQKPAEVTEFIYLMGEATPNTMSWWHPQAFEKAFQDGQLKLETLELFINEIKEMVPTIRDTVATNLLAAQNKP